MHNKNNYKNINKIYKVKIKNYKSNYQIIKIYNFNFQNYNETMILKISYRIKRFKNIYVNKIFQKSNYKNLIKLQRDLNKKIKIYRINLNKKKMILSKSMKNNQSKNNKN